MITNILNSSVVILNFSELCYWRATKQDVYKLKWITFCYLTAGWYLFLKKENRRELLWRTEFLVYKWNIYCGLYGVSRGSHFTISRNKCMIIWNFLRCFLKKISDVTSECIRISRRAEMCARKPLISFTNAFVWWFTVCQ